MRKIYYLPTYVVLGYALLAGVQLFGTLLFGEPKFLAGSKGIILYIPLALTISLLPKGLTRLVTEVFGQPLLVFIGITPAGWLISSLIFSGATFLLNWLIVNLAKTFLN